MKEQSVHVTHYQIVKYLNALQRGCSDESLLIRAASYIWQVGI